jgi:hypothetical protein
MKYTFLIICACLLHDRVDAQDTFGEFINSFPELAWNQIPEDVRNIKSSRNTMEPEKANTYIYSGKYRGEEKPVENNRTRKPPLRMAGDGSYFWADEEGRYSNQYSLNLNGRDTVIYYRMYPLSRVRINDSICMIFLLYEGPGSDMGYGDNSYGTNLYYEAYTFNTVRERVLSSITLFRDSKIFFSYIRQDRTVSIYQEYEYFKYYDESETDYDEISTIARRTYYLRDDGFFQLMNNEFLAEDRKIAEFTVIDDDGYTNVREQPTTASKVLYTIEEGYGGILEITDHPNWYQVIYSSNGLARPGKDAHIRGWIHKSRICFDPDKYGWKKGDEQVCPR